MALDAKGGSERPVVIEDNEKAAPASAAVARQPVKVSFRLTY